MRRTLRPAFALTVSIAAYLAHRPLIETARLQIDATALGLIAGAASHFAAPAPH
ncbi:MAG: hypothetical protein RIB97_11690 [Nitratireductor sp.]